jgi:hypothetical protein
MPWLLGPRSLAARGRRSSDLGSAGDSRAHPAAPARCDVSGCPAPGERDRDHATGSLHLCYGHDLLVQEVPAGYRLSVTTAADGRPLLSFETTRTRRR